MRPYIRASAFRLVDFFDRYFRGLGSPLPQRPRGICLVDFFFVCPLPYRGSKSCSEERSSFQEGPNQSANQCFWTWPKRVDLSMAMILVHSICVNKANSATVEEVFSVLMHITNLTRPKKNVDIGAKLIICSLHTSQEPRPQELLRALKAL